MRFLALVIYNKYLSNHELLWKAGAKNNLADLPSQHLEGDGGSTLISALKEARDQKEPYINSVTQPAERESKRLGNANIPDAEEYEILSP